ALNDLVVLGTGWVDVDDVDEAHQLIGNVEILTAGIGDGPKGDGLRVDQGRAQVDLANLLQGDRIDDGNFAAVAERYIQPAVVRRQRHRPRAVHRVRIADRNAGQERLRRMIADDVVVDDRDLVGTPQSRKDVVGVE